MSVDTTAPTRMNLLARRSQIKLASEGVTLLTGKREALLKELLKRARELRVLREELHRRGRKARAATSLARGLRGTAEVQSVAEAGRRPVDARIDQETVWGLELFDARVEGVVRGPAERGVGNLDMSSHVLEAAEAAEEMVEQLILCAPVEANLQILGEEIRNVSRRINALEEHLLPRLRGDARRIGRVLDEREREDVFRLKRLKSKKRTASPFDRS
ncbi:MAG: V-type ATP synthase subunit D [bacterium]|nr:V-type ATP synthase subunit D [bacterium]